MIEENSNNRESANKGDYERKAVVKTVIYSRPQPLEQRETNDMIEENIVNY